MCVTLAFVILIGMIFSSEGLVLNGNERSECDCRPAQSPAFMAAISAQLDSCTHNQAILFDYVLTNVVNGYSPTHGIFRAPISGTYTFSMTLVAPPHKKLYATIVKNISTVGFVFTDEYDTWETLSTTVVLHLNFNEEVWVTIRNQPSTIAGDANHGNYGANDIESQFTGFLISAD